MEKTAILRRDVFSVLTFGIKQDIIHKTIKRKDDL